MRIGEAAALAGLEPSTIRFYEQSGVLPAPERMASGYRDYTDEEVDLIRFVRRIRRLEIPLEDVRQIVELRNRGEAPCAVVREVMAREAAAIKSRIRELQELHGELERLQAKAGEFIDVWPQGPSVCQLVEAEADAESPSPPPS
ncbi:MAG: MerR family transcriptional regulator [Actinobacteria bacterium]|nr:MerR family transcriptional regulator [Actinomycetota bacterium]